MQARHDKNYNLLAELNPGVSVQQAQADVNLIANRIRVKDKRDRTFGMTLVLLLDQPLSNTGVSVRAGSLCIETSIRRCGEANHCSTHAGVSILLLSTGGAAGAATWALGKLKVSQTEQRLFDVGSSRFA